MAKVGDTVRFLNQVGGGKITKIEGNLAFVEDADGFEQPVLVRECVVVEEAKAKPTAYDRPMKAAPSKEVPAPVVAKPKPAPVVEETPGGDVLNVVLAYEPEEPKHLNTTKYFAYLVNDSNYFLHVTYMTRSDSDELWQVRAIEEVEPNMQVQLDEFAHDALINMDRVAVQYIAYKRDRGFKLKNPALVEHRLDTTKFYKTHCFHDSEYFDVPVIQLDVVKGDRPARQMVIDSADLERAMKEKRQHSVPVKRRAERQPLRAKNEPIVVDLHIHELLDDTRGMTSGEMLEYQMKKFREVMDANIKHDGERVVFIHGKGEGVLRKAILDELHRKYSRCVPQDASFREYGFGATLVTIYNDKKIQRI